MDNALEVITFYTRGKGNPNVKPKSSSKYDINDPSLTNGL